MGNIFQAINAAMGDIEPIAKDRTNVMQKFKFRGIDDIMNELQPVLQKHGIFIVPEAIDIIREEKQTKSGGALLYSIVKMKYTFYALDGSNVSAIVIGEGMDSGDKASNKAMAVAMKYALLQVFCIPTEDAKDPDGESHEVVRSEIASIKSALIDYINAGAFEHPENVEKVMRENNVEQMKKAIEIAKGRK